MARSSSPSAVCLALVVLLCAAPAADALCYWSPITFVRTCTSWSFPSSSSSSSYASSSPPAAAAAAALPPPPSSSYNSPGRAWGPMYRNPTPSPYAPAKPNTLAHRPYHPTEAPTPAPHVVAPATPAPTRGCFGSLPFGLENCVCDGAVVGEAAGVAACSAVFTQCATIQQFSVDGGKQLGAVQRACDSLTASSCSMTAKQLAMAHPVCRSLLAGEGSCTSDEAMALLDASVKDGCDPLCPDCAGVDGPAAQPTQLPAAYTTATEAVDNYPIATAKTTNDEPVVGSDNAQKPTREAPAKQQTLTKPQMEEPQQAGCFGDLPMGLEQCVCDGATIGEAAGLAACSAVFAECMDFVPFSVNEAAPPSDNTCDSLAQSACVDSGMQLAMAHQPCAQLLFEKGFSSKCSTDKARGIFQAQMEGICAPLCPDCPRLPF